VLSCYCNLLMIIFIVHSCIFIMCYVRRKRKQRKTGTAKSHHEDTCTHGTARQGAVGCVVQVYSMQHAFAMHAPTTKNATAITPARARARRTTRVTRDAGVGRGGTAMAHS
jgi:hypothetical protein